MFYPAGVNPGVHLYNHWLNLLQAQRPTLDPPDYRFRGHDLTSKYPVVSYGAHRCAVGVWSFDDQRRPILVYGYWYNNRWGVHAYMLLRADGAFHMLWPWGDNHNRISNHTFLRYGMYGGQYVWHVDPQHGIRATLDLKDWRNPVQYVRERILLKRYVDYSNRRDNWVALEPDGGFWMMQPAPDASPEFKQAFKLDGQRVHRAYKRLKNKHYKETGQKPPVTKLSDGGKQLSGDAAIQHIAAFLTVTQPAKPVPLKRKREVSV